MSWQVRALRVCWAYSASARLTLRFRGASAEFVGQLGKSADPLRSSGEAWCVTIALSLFLFLFSVTIALSLFLFLFSSPARNFERSTGLPPPPPPSRHLRFLLLSSSSFFSFPSLSFSSFPSLATSSRGGPSLALVRLATSPSVLWLAQPSLDVSWSRRYVSLA